MDRTYPTPLDILTHLRGGKKLRSTVTFTSRVTDSLKDRDLIVEYRTQPCPHLTTT